MRAEMNAVAAVWMGIAVASTGGMAQRNEANNPIADQIRVQEAAVASAAGETDGTAWLKLAVLYQDAARYEDAEPAFNRAIRLLKTRDHTLYADALDHMGTMYVERGKFGKAEPLERKALAIREDANDTSAIGTSYMHLAVLAYGQHDMAAADSDAGMAVSLLVPERATDRTRTEATPEEKMSALIDLSLIKCARGDCAGSIPELNRALCLAHANYEANSVPVGFLDFLLGYATWKNGDVKQAPDLMKRGIDEMQQPLGWGHPTYIAALKQYRSLLTQIGSHAEADEVDRRIALLEPSPKSSGRPARSALLGMNALR
jgi:tetratricopeptide (TPR) repeat protein